MLAITLHTAAPAVAQDLITFIPRGAEWRYRDVGAFPGPTWYTSGFPDAGWLAGPAELGYGDGDESTKVGYGSNPDARYVTTYFRHLFSVADASLIHGLALRLLVDDGAIAYLNGTEILRYNMPNEPVTYGTLADNSLGGVTEKSWRTFRISPTLLTTGPNVLAVEVHQAAPDSNDLSFDLELVQTGPDTLMRGPFLQSAAPDRVTVRWDTGAPSIGVVRYGTSPDDLSNVMKETSPVFPHAITLGDLQPDTRYYYTVSSDTATTPSEPDVHTFRTAPAAGSAAMTRIWVLGDAGYPNANLRAVSDAYRAFAGLRPADVWLLLGDNAYPDGTDDQYQATLFDEFPQELASIPVWPTLGNHDVRSSTSETQTGPYFDIFALPKGAEAGGEPSGTESYYSFDYANIHFVCLNSEDTDRTPDGPMLTWLKNDLARTTSTWTIAFWHAAPYSHGSHNSDTEGRMVVMRTNAVPILEEAGVDLVFTGHSHAYERSFLLDGHYGTSDTFTELMKKAAGTGRIDEGGAYVKPTAGRAPHEGAVYVVAGSASSMYATTMDHPANAVAHRSLGSVLLDVNGARLDVAFLDDEGRMLDHFTLLKGQEWVTPHTVEDAVAVLSRAIGISPTTPEDLARWNVDIRAGSFDRLDLMDAALILRAASQ